MTKLKPIIWVSFDNHTDAQDADKYAQFLKNEFKDEEVHVIVTQGEVDIKVFGYGEITKMPKSILRWYWWFFKSLFKRPWAS